MPLPLAHSAIGFAVNEFSGRNQSLENRWKRWAFVVFLANLPDVDVLVGLIVHGNGSAFHRGPAHSLLFALVMGWLASKAWRYWARDSSFSFLSCLGLIVSHVFADAVFTASPVSFLWPLEVHWTAGHCGWLDVMNSLFHEPSSDLGLILGSGAVVAISRLLKSKASPHLHPYPVTVAGSARSKKSKSTP